MPKHKHPRKPSKPQTHPIPKNKKQKLHHQPSQQPNPRPWPRTADILLIGEGDFSFAHSLYTKHRDCFHSVTATCFDSRDELLAKYASAARLISELETPSPSASNVDRNTEDEDDEETWRSSNEAEDAQSDRADPSELVEQRRPAKILYNINARKLPTSKPLKNRHFDVVIFNFPHVGGVSKDVNRQVRHNQSLLVDFFNAAKPFLVPANPRSRARRERKSSEGGADRKADSKARANNEARGAGDDDIERKGKVMITLFEREPYTLWNIRDLARHCGYVVERSWRFDWGSWEGYAHVRTLGDLRARGGQGQGVRVAKGRVAKVGRAGEEGEEEEEEEKGDVDEEDTEADEEEWNGFSDEGEEDEQRGNDETQETSKKKPGRWHGEDREARTYLFSLKDDDGDSGGGHGQATKRKKGQDSDSD